MSFEDPLGLPSEAEIEVKQLRADLAVMAEKAERYRLAALVPEMGRSLRDHFAGQALIGMMAFATGGTFDPTKNSDQFAWASYVLADAMLAERAKGGPES